MKLLFHDFNGADGLFGTTFLQEWQELAEVVARLPLHLKPSDQAGKQGSPIFDPVAANSAIKMALASRGWLTNLPIPGDLNFLGKDVDFFHNGILAEAQFSNYPFFLNNVVRSALLAKSRAVLNGQTVRAVAILAKGKMFPSSNSTLYYEQAVKQLTEFAKHGIFDVPIRVIGLVEQVGVPVSAVWNEYPGRYSRELSSGKRIKVRLVAGRSSDSTCKIILPAP